MLPMMKTMMLKKAKPKIRTTLLQERLHKRLSQSKIQYNGIHYAYTGGSSSMPLVTDC